MYRQRDRSIRQRPVTLEEAGFSDMSDSDLRYHMYAELKMKWEEEHPNKVIPNGVSYTLHEQARSWADDAAVRKSRKVAEV